MPAPDYRPELEAATEAARRAGDLIRRYAGKALDIREKGTHDLVTQADEEAQRLIQDTLAAAFPDYEFLGEEGTTDDDLLRQREAAGPRWIVDPIDGTTNFAHGVPPYCVSISLQDEGELVLGVVYEVSMDEMFAAVKGHGLTVNGEPARVSDTADLGSALVTTGFPFREFWYIDEYLGVLRHFMLHTRGVRRPGSAAADLAWVACGRFDAFFEGGLSPWDVAAGIVLVREGGGRISGLTDGVDPLFGRQLIASNGRVHDAIQAVTERLGRVVAAGPAAVEQRA